MILFSEMADGSCLMSTSALFDVYNVFVSVFEKEIYKEVLFQRKSALQCLSYLGAVSGNKGWNSKVNRGAKWNSDIMHFCFISFLLKFNGTVRSKFLAYNAQSLLCIINKASKMDG